MGTRCPWFLHAQRVLHSVPAFRRRRMTSQSIVGSCRALFLCALLFPAATITAAPVTYLFTLNSANSTTTADLQVAGQTSGTMAGNHDPLTNPTGTRTKPGLL